MFHIICKQKRIYLESIEFPFAELVLRWQPGIDIKTERSSAVILDNACLQMDSKLHRLLQDISSRHTKG